MVEHLNQRHNIRAKIDLKAKVQIEKELKVSNVTSVSTSSQSPTKMNIPTPNNTMKCQYCQDKFPNKARLLEHIRDKLILRHEKKNALEISFQSHTGRT